MTRLPDLPSPARRIAGALMGFGLAVWLFFFLGGRPVAYVSAIGAGVLASLELVSMGLRWSKWRRAFAFLAGIVVWSLATLATRDVELIWGWASDGRVFAAGAGMVILLGLAILGLRTVSRL